MSSRRLARLDRHLDDYVDRGRISGYLVAIARRGRIVHEHRYGWSNVASRIPMGRDTIFRIYSMSKPITGAATMVALEEGLFLLDEPVAKYLPSLGGPQVMVGVGDDGRPLLEPARQPITIRDLLTHTSGLAYSFTAPPALREIYLAKGVDPGRARDGRDVLGGVFASRPTSLADFVERLRGLPLAAQPGSRWNYSIGMDVLGRLIEVVSGESFAAFLESRIFAPLSMGDTGFRVPEEKLHRLAVSYGLPPSDAPDGGEPGEAPVSGDTGFVPVDRPEDSPFREDPAVPSGGGGLVSTAEDYMRFAMMLARGGELGGVRILSPKTVDLMLANHLPDSMGEQPLGFLGERLLSNGGRGVGFGFTGSVVTQAAQTLLPVSDGLFSWGGAASTFFWVDRHEELVGVFMTQLVPSGTYPFRSELLLLSYQAITD